MRIRLIAAVFACATFLACPLAGQVQGAWANTGTIHSALEYNVQVLLGSGKVLVAGGTDGTNYFAAAQLFNPTTGTWSATGSMATGRAQFAAVVLPGGKVLVEGGTGAGAAIFASAELYDPVHGTWSPAGNMSVARFGHTATLLQDGTVMVTGGCVSSSCSSVTGVTGVTEIYHPKNNTWTTTNYPLSTARAFQTATLLGNGKVLVVGGCHSSYCLTSLASSEIYNSTNNTWTNGPTSSVVRNGHSATLLANGKVLVAGGGAPHTEFSQVDLYDPSANTFTPTGAMKKGRSGHTATALPNNTVLMAGGYVLVGCGKYPCGAPTSTSEVYDVSTASFSNTGTLNVAHASHTATLLQSNDVLVVGGCTVRYCSSLTAASEIYTPLTLSISSYSLNFGLEQTRVTSPAQTVTVTNVSHGSVTFTGIAASGDYHQTNNCPATLASGNSCTITITFNPTTTGTLTGAVTLHDNSVGSPTQTIALTGVGEQYAVTLTPNPLTLPPAVPGYYSTATATVTNDGGTAVNISSMSIAPADGVFTIMSSTCPLTPPLTLGVQQTCKVTVKFTPPDSVTFTETLQIFDNAPGSPHLLTLTGVGID